MESYDSSNAFDFLIRYSASRPGVDLEENLHSLFGCQREVECLVRRFAFRKGTKFSGYFLHGKNVSESQMNANLEHAAKMFIESGVLLTGGQAW